MEFPAVSQSRIEFWKQPQYTQNGMWWFTLFFGWFGLHHLLLRSPQTALLFCIGNVLTFGYMYFYDLIQLSTHTTESLNTYGLGHPWGPLGLAQGMWVSPKDIPTEEPPPNPWWFFAYALLLPIAPLAQSIAGDMQNALSRFMFLTIIPFGFILYGASVAWDAWSLLGKPADLVVNGTKRFFPFTVLGYDRDGHSPRITGIRDLPQPTCPPSGNWFLGTIFETIKFFLRFTLPVLYAVNPALALSLDQAINTTTESSGKIVAVAKSVVNAAEAVGTSVVKTADVVSNTAVHVAEDGSKVLKTVGKLAGSIGDLSKIPLNKAQTLVTSTPDLLQNSVTQKGGGQSMTPLDYAVGGGLAAVILGGFLLTGGRILSNVASSSVDDTPPDT